MTPVTLTGQHIRLETLTREHIAGLVAAAGTDRAAYPWSAVPIGLPEVTRYVETAIVWFEAGMALPFATVRIADGVVIGSALVHRILDGCGPEGAAEFVTELREALDG